MKNLKYLIIFVLGAAAMTLFSVWLAMNRITFVFSIAALGYPQNWGFVAINFVLLSLFLVFIAFRRKIARLPSSIYIAFIVALYFEMYGFALTMYVINAVFGFNNTVTLWYLLSILTGTELFYSIFLSVILPISNIIILSGIFLIIFGWQRIYKKKGKLVTIGIYAQIRHPQYLGFMLFTAGIDFLWPTFSTLLLWPILVFLYYRLAKEEEGKLEETFGEEYRKYKNAVPRFAPKWSRVKEIFT
jgi:protein-S-isoprenylcysteine O-methyltransferase Ste14